MTVPADPTDSIPPPGEADDHAAPRDFDPGMHFLEAKVAKKPLQSFPRLVAGAVKLVRDASPNLFYWSLILQLGSAGLTAAQIYAGKVAIAEILRAQARHGSLSVAVPGLAALLAATALSNAIGGIATSVQRVLADRVVFSAWEVILDVTTSVNLATFESPSFFDDLQRIETNALSRPVTLLQGLIALLSGFMTIVGLGVALIAIAPILLPVLLLAGLPLAVLSRRGSGLEYRFQLRQTKGGRFRYYLIQLQADRDHAKELRAFGTVEFLRARWRQSYDDYFADLVGHVRRLSLLATGSALISTAVLGLAIGVVVELVLHHHLTLAAAGAGILAARTLSSQIASMFSGIQQIFECTFFLSDIDAFSKRAAVNTPAPDAEPLSPLAPLRRLEIKNVGFTYPESSKAALRGVSLDIEAGQIVALVGENGSGKTTLAKLICGLLAPTGGEMRWNGRMIAAEEASQIGSRVAVIFQDYAKYAFSAADNIAIGDVDRPSDLGYTIEMAKRAGIHEVLEGLDDGYETMLGRVFGGIDLSIGQWQRVAIARAFYRDAELLILDEPTSALDPRAEAAIFDRMRELAGGRTVLIISHRFSTVKSADQIVVLESGSVIEKGNHDVLMRLGGRYAELFELQARAYR